MSVTTSTTSNKNFLIYVSSAVIVVVLIALAVIFFARPAADPSVTTPKGDLLSVTVISDGLEARVIRLADNSEVTCMVTTNGNNRPNSVDCNW